MQQPFDLESLYDLTFVTAVAVAPDGERVAFVADEFDGQADDRFRSVFVVPADGSRPPHRLTRSSDGSTPQWSPDGTRLGFLAARETDPERRIGREDESDADRDDATDGDDEPTTQVWAFDLDRGGDARQITDFEEGAADFDWGPAGDRLVVAARDPTDEQRASLESRRDEGGPIETERLQHKFDGHGWLDEVRTYLFVVDVATGDATRLDDAYGGGIAENVGCLEPRWSPDGEAIAFRSNRTEHPDDSYVMDVYTVQPDGSSLRKLTDSDVTASALRWSPDGDHLAFVGQDPENWYVPDDLRIVEPASGERQSVSGDLDRPVMGVVGVEWADQVSLVAAIGDEGQTRLARFFVDGSGPERAFDWQGRYRTVDALDLGGGTAAIVLSDPSEGTDVYALETDAIRADERDTDSARDTENAPRRLTEVNAEFVGERDLSEVRRLTFANGDGQTVESIVALPADFDADDPSSRPCVTIVHGGPIWYDSPRFSFEEAFWTAQGYVVHRPNYRGSSSYGRAFSEAIRGDWRPREVRDVLAGVDELVDRDWTDPDRQFVTGFSYGGIASAWLVAETDRFAAGAPEHGIYDFYSAFGTDDSHRWASTEFGLPWETPETYHEMSSVRDVDDVDTPLLITAGGEDWRCPPTQAEQLYVSVRKRGVPAKLVVYPEEHHKRLADITSPDRVIHRLQSIAEWFETHDPGRDTERESGDADPAVDPDAEPPVDPDAGQGVPR